MTTQRNISRGILTICVLLAGVVLWIFPAVFFPAPGANDAPILWNLPLPVVGLTLIGALVAVARPRQKGDSKTGSIALGVYLIGGTVIGVTATVVLVLWMLARGARDWLLAPYGFDICLLIALEAAIVFFVGGWWRSAPSVAHA